MKLLTRMMLWLVIDLAALVVTAPAAMSQEADISGSLARNQITLSGEWRLRLEGLTGQFRANNDARDQALLSRLLLRADGQHKRLLWRIELQDSRSYLDDDNTPLSTNFVNPLDILEANIGFVVDARQSEVRLGRFTQNVGSRRLFARNGFRNTINGFSGLNSRFHHSDGSETRIIFAFPVIREPLSFDALRSNELALDKENFNQRVWSVWHRRPLSWADAEIELYSFGLFEDDSRRVQTRNREIYTPGVRIYRRPQRGIWDFDFENVYQFGTGRMTTAADDITNLDVSAHFHHGEVGYSFDSDWNIRISVEYDFASGDGDAGNGIFGRFDTVAGVRRRTFGNTSLFGPLSRDNISQFGARLSFEKDRWDGRIHILQANLEQAEDQLLVAGLIDPTGAAGDDIGLLISGRLRYWAVPDTLRLETGYGVLAKGRFTRTAPGANPSGDTYYGYVQITTRF